MANVLFIENTMAQRQTVTMSKWQFFYCYFQQSVSAEQECKLFKDELNF